MHSVLHRRSSSSTIFYFNNNVIMSIDRDIQEKVSLFLSARSLLKKGTFSSSTPSAFAVLYCKDTKLENFIKFSRTDIIKDSSDPDWIVGITVNYLFEVVQEIIVRVYNKEGSYSLDDESKHTLLGESSFFLASLMCSTGQKLELRMGPSGGVGSKAAPSGTVIVRGESQANVRDVFCVTFFGRKLSNKEGYFSTSDPFLVISRMNEDGTYTKVWENTKIDSNLNPSWAPARISMIQLCNGDAERPLRIEIWDWEKSGRHHFMGQVDTSVSRMVRNNGIAEMVIEPEKVKSKKGYTNSGTLTATNVVVESHPTFTDFIQGGCEISLIVALDFTASNGHPAEPTSLHYINPMGALNPYQQAIVAVGNVLQAYDTDNMYPVYGFGAKVRLPNGQTSVVQHCFPVYGGGLEAKGVGGILKAYTDCLSNVMLSGPTLFAPLLNAASDIAMASNCSQARQKYSVLLIITDGEINDMDATKEALVRAAQQPLSVIIVGVGSANFASMKQLDNLKLVLNNGVRRDLVEFVSFNDVVSLGPSVLGARLLAQIPTQLLQYMAGKSIKPNAKRA